VKILSVDDHPDNLYLIEAAARACGHEVVNAHHGIEGMGELEKQSFDVIVSDILMPEMDGFRFCREVKTREELKHIPFVFYTATYTGRQDRELGLSLGASRFVIKPTDPAEFIQILEEVFTEAAAGKLPSPDIPSPEEHDYLKAYNQRLIAKLERKIEQLESASKELAAALAEKEREILQRRLAETELRLANFTLENASIGIFWGTIDKTIGNRHFTRVNAAASRMTGYTEAELLKMSMADLDGAAQAETGDWRLRPDQAGTMESEHRHKDGHTYPVELAVSFMDFEGREYVVTFARDITERHEAERQKAQLDTQLQQAQKMESLGRLTGGIAHDFNNSLSVILGYTEMLKTSLNRGPEAAEAVDAIWKAGIRSKDLVGQLLGFSRQQIIVPQPLNLNHVLAGSKKLLTRLIGEDIELQVSPGAGLWDVLLDPTQADQVLMNLAANARDAMPSGGRIIFATSNILVDETYRIHNPLARMGNYVLLEVTDTGEGMDTETAVRAFEPFFTTKAKGKGTGLGLATVYGIVRQNQGFIILYSEPGHGTSFKIYFPRLTGATWTPVAVPAAVMTRGSRKGTILLVEDDALVRDMTAELLKMLGYTTLIATDARDAIRICEDLTQPVDLVISDVVMPDLKGTELRDRLVAIRPGLRVLFVSGYSSDIVVRPGVLNPDVRFLQKPFTLRDLASRIDELLGTSGPSRGLTEAAGGAGLQ
jgi:two-component system cell cycle sensor histidine kinase/response regulator CckA